MKKVELESEVLSFIELCRHNFGCLQRNLERLGYRFARGEEPFVVNQTHDIARDELTSFGEVPKLIREWYRRFRYVDFSQADDQLYGSGSEAVSGLGYNNVLCFLEVSRCIQIRNQLHEEGFRVNDGGSRFIPLGGIASNCEPKGIWLPCREIDPIIYDDGAGPVTFSQEIADAFARGGFPFWDRMFRKRIITSPIGLVPNFREIRDTLIEGMAYDY